MGFWKAFAAVLGGVVAVAGAIVVVTATTMLTGGIGMACMIGGAIDVITVSQI